MLLFVQTDSRGISLHCRLLGLLICTSHHPLITCCQRNNRTMSLCSFLGHSPILRVLLFVKVFTTLLLRQFRKFHTHSQSHPQHHCAGPSWEIHSLSKPHKTQAMFCCKPLAVIILKVKANSNQILST